MSSERRIACLKALVVNQQARRRRLRAKASRTQRTMWTTMRTTLRLPLRLMLRLPLLVPLRLPLRLLLRPLLLRLLLLQLLRLLLLLHHHHLQLFHRLPSPPSPCLQHRHLHEYLQQQQEQAHLVRGLASRWMGRSSGGSKRHARALMASASTMSFTGLMESW